MADYRPDDKRGNKKAAWDEGIAGGFRNYLPAGVGIAVVGLPLCAIAAIAHFVLGVQLEVNVPSVAAGGGLVWRYFSANR